MLDTNDIQVISEIVSNALAEERKHHDEEHKTLRQQIREDMMTIIEAEVNPKLQILAEGQQMLFEKFQRMERADDLREDVIVLKKAVKKLNKEMKELKKAQ